MGKFGGEIPIFSPRKIKVFPGAGIVPLSRCKMCKLKKNKSAVQSGFAPCYTGSIQQRGCCATAPASGA
jgi:hypothetical protein